jgi:hypothetical protein
MSAANPVYMELLDFLAAGMTPEALVAFRPSDGVQDRVKDLIARKQDGALAPEEESELEEFLHLEHILILAKAKARQHIPLGQ